MLRFFKQLINIYLKKKVPRAAAELSYCLTLSFFPLLICINAMLATFNINEVDIISLGEGIVPGSTLRVIAEYVEYVGVHFSPAMLAGALVLMATTSSAAFRSIMGIMAEIQGEHRYRGFWSTVFSFIYSILFLAAIYLSCIVVVTGNWFLEFAAEHLGVSAVGAGIWRWIRFVLLFIILLFIIYGVYRLSAPREKPRSARLPGAFIATVAMVIASMFFSWTMELSSRYPLIYGSLASIIILMIWLFICGNILIMGNAINFILNNSENVRRKTAKKELKLRETADKRKRTS
ncbi:MAG: YihY/virulence factor BrkB family protein [Clostridiales bacterium]|jgi:membrane protein|nr:YihY/virulence factor BrkB family protein [Clostridiales bacterium]